MTTLLWLTVALPLAAAVLARWAPGGDRAVAVAGAGAAASVVPSAALLAFAADGRQATSTVGWLPAADLDVGLRLDPLSAVMSVTVAAIGLVVVVYAAGYFAEHRRRRSALAGLLAFLAAMQGLVLADGYLALLVFWELVGAASARLIAFNRDDPGAAPGAVRAFLTTRTADLGLYVAVLAVFAATGSLAFLDARPEGGLGAVVALGLIVAAIGKSAQAPLQTWLMGAMAGPTPVSALLHSATMVAAGVYLLARSHEVLAGWPLVVVGWVGAITAVLSAAVALGQQDLKRVLAGSTSSQLGLMFVGLAAGGPLVAVFHLVVHAAGKACMFLAAGVFGHERGSTSLDRLAGAGRRDRGAFAAFAVGALSIAAVPPLAGFFSKEHIAAAAEHHAGWFALVLVATAGAAAYLLRPARILWSAPAGEPDGQRAAGRRLMVASAAALAFASAGLAFAGAPLQDVLGGELPSSAASIVLSLLALAAGAAGVLSGVAAPAGVRMMAARQFFTATVQDAVAVRAVPSIARMTDRLDRRALDAVVDGLPRVALRLSAGVAVADHRGVDAVVDGTAEGALLLADRSVAFERGGIDGAVDGLARLIGAGGRRSRRLQSGRLYEYLRDTALGAVAVVIVIALAAVF